LLSAAAALCGVLAMALAVLRPSDNQRDIPGPLVISRPTETDGSLFADAIVQKYCSLHVRGSVSGSLTIELGADVLVDGSVHGKIVNRGGRLVVNHKGLTACVAHEGPPESEVGAVLTINLTAISYNWERLAKCTDAECAAVLECNAYGCGVDWVADALVKSGCRTFFVTNLAEARRVRTVAPDSTIYVMHGLHAGAAPLFANLNVRPVISSALQFGEWSAFASSDRWSGGCALNVDTGANGLGLSMEEAVELSATMGAADSGITLLMSSMARTDRANDPHAEHQIALFNELRRLYHGIPTSLAGATAILLDRRTHFDLVRADSALFGINPVRGSANPMLPVIELAARIVQVRNTTPERNFFNKGPKRRRLAFVSIGHADGFPRSWHPKAKLYAIVDGHRCPVTAPSSVDVLAIDVTDLPDDRAAGSGEMATLIGSTMTIDEVAEATRSTGQEVLTALGNRFHRTYYAT
jgi:alanine racemase